MTGTTFDENGITLINRWKRKIASSQSYKIKLRQITDMRCVSALLVLAAASASLVGTASAEYYLNTGCYPSQQCTAAGSCESSTTYTTHAGCTVGDMQVSV